MLIFNWVTIPFFGGVGFVIGLAILIGVSLLALGSSIPVVGAGGLTSRERLARQSVLGRSVLVTPLVSIIALAFFIAPLKQPVNIFLVSRSQPATLDKVQADALAAHVSAATGEIADVHDVGPTVDAVLVDLLRERFVWRPGAVVQEGAIRRAVMQRVAEMELSTVLGIDNLKSASSALPRWVIESAEIGVLKAATQRFNVRHISIVAFDRRTDAGGVWSDVPTYLRNGSIRSAGTEVPPPRLLPDTRKPQIRFARLVSGDTAASFSLELWFEVPGCSGCGTDTATVEVTSQSEFITAVPVPVPRGNMPRIERVNVPIRAAWPIDANVFVSTVDPPAVVLVRTGRAAVMEPAIVQVRSQQAEQWQQTLETLKHADDSSIVRWRRRLEERGLNLNGLTFPTVLCGDELGGDVVVDDCRGPTLIYPRTVDTSGLELESRSLPSRAGHILRARVTPFAQPGVDSFDGVSLDGTTFFTLGAASGSLSAACDATFIDEYGGSPVDGSLIREPSMKPLVQRLNSVERTSQQYVMLFGSSADAQRVFVRQPGVAVADPARAFAFWTFIVDSIRLTMSRTEQGCGAIQEIQEPSGPVAVLRSADLQNVQGRGVIIPLVLVLASLLARAGFFAFGIQRQ